MAEAIFLGAQIVYIVGRWGRLKRNLLDDFYAVNFEPIDFLRIVGKYFNLLEAQVAKNLCAYAVIAFVWRKTKLDIRIHGIESLFLQLIRVKFICQANAPALLPQIYESPLPAFSINCNAASNCLPHSHRCDRNKSPVIHSECTRTRIGSSC